MITINMQKWSATVLLILLATLKKLKAYLLSNLSLSSALLKMMMMMMMMMMIQKSSTARKEKKK
jgi:hypothetical protein